MTNRKTNTREYFINELSPRSAKRAYNEYISNYSSIHIEDALITVFGDAEANIEGEYIRQVRKQHGIILQNGINDFTYKNVGIDVDVELNNIDFTSFLWDSLNENQTKFMLHVLNHDNIKAEFLKGLDDADDGDEVRFIVAAWIGNMEDKTGISLEECYATLLIMDNKIKQIKFEIGKRIEAVYNYIEDFESFLDKAEMFNWKFDRWGKRIFGS